MKTVHPLYKYVLGIAAMMLMAFSMSAKAAVSVAWTAPLDGSTFPVGTSASPQGQATATGTAGSGLDLALVLDSSGSMTVSQTVGGVTQSRAQWQKDAAIALVNNLPTTEISVAVIEFDEDAGLLRQLTPLSTDKALVIAAINSVGASGGTLIGSGITQATAELTGANHTLGRSRQMVVFSGGETGALGQAYQAAADAVTAGVDNVHAVALPGANLGQMQGIATFGNGTFFDASTAQGIQDLIDLFSGAGGTLVGIDRVDITMPDGTLIGSIAVDPFGNFVTPAWLMELGLNTFVATAYDTLGNSASASLTLNGVAIATPEPGILGLLGLGLISIFGLRRRKV